MVIFAFSSLEIGQPSLAFLGRFIELGFIRAGNLHLHLQVGRGDRES